MPKTKTAQARTAQAVPAEPVPDDADRDEVVPELFYRMASGAFGRVALTGGEGLPPLPEGAIEMTAEEYVEALSGWQDNKDAVEAARETERLQHVKAAYEGLVTAGVPESAARYLSGYTGEE